MSLVPQGSASTNTPRESTSSHPPSSAPDPTVSSQHATQAGQSTASTASPSELADLKVKLKAGLRQYPDFPSPGILFEDIMPLFANPDLHSALIRAHELQFADAFAGQKIDVVVGLESRGFLVGPTLAHKLNAGFVPEYGEDHFQMQADSIKTGQRVVILDDIIATGGTAAAAGSLVRQLGGELLGFVFMLELDFLKGRDKLDAPVFTLLSGQEEKSST
ncbi:hypothetical protein AMS68_005003 [Peltaster fructicola]|uniref:adenine phosphoribosyltransferase n=1 Tax=Peltaster fructicola TaxID=286661 RepID=A0A6H0XXS2_9PEZI|nr:hypothetical protein AMS68_005003 [Peltaster fructicola]